MPSLRIRGPVKTGFLAMKYARAHGLQLCVCFSPEDTITGITWQLLCYTAHNDLPPQVFSRL